MQGSPPEPTTLAEGGLATPAPIVERIGARGLAHMGERTTALKAVIETDVPLAIGDLAQVLSHPDAARLFEAASGLALGAWPGSPSVMSPSATAPCSPAATWTFTIADTASSGFLGPPVSGTGTILPMILALKRPNVGEILTSGRLVTEVPRAGRNVAMVFQNLALLPHVATGKSTCVALARRRERPVVRTRPTWRPRCASATSSSRPTTMRRPGVADRIAILEGRRI